MYLKCTVLHVLTYVSTHENIHTIKIMEIPISKSFLTPVGNPQLCHSSHFPKFRPQATTDLFPVTID